MREAAVIRGDGIGPEITDATVRVLEAAGAKLRWVETPVGAGARAALGSPLPWDSLEKMRQIGIALKAPLIAEKASGGVEVETPGGLRRYPSVNNGLRREMACYANLRPVRGHARVSGPYAGLDLVIVREVTEEAYCGEERQVDADTAESIKRITGTASRRIARFAFEYARRNGRKRVSAIHKANVLHLTDGLFLSSVREVALGYPEIQCDDKMIDAACFLLVRRPELFDVMVLPNQYGDIVSDLAAGLAGSMGLAPGANLGDGTAFFEAAHGAAPDIAGQGIANPMALVLSGALLLDHVGDTEAASRVRDAVDRVLSHGCDLTPDLGGSASTARLADALCSACQN
jgi:isocitrate dehydrogenase (NAD+)